MTVNPNGYVPITDGGTPRIITGYARETITSGQFCGGSGAAGVVSSGADSFATSDILFNVTAGSGNFIGLALHDAASGASLSVATRGAFLLPVSGANILAGTKVGCNAADDLVVATAANHYDVGRAWTCGSAANFIVADIHG